MNIEMNNSDCAKKLICANDKSFGVYILLVYFAFKKYALENSGGWFRVILCFLIQ